MSLFRKVEPADARIWDGEASFSQIMDASRDTALYVDNYNSEEYAREEAFEDAISKVKRLTGIDLKNPQIEKDPLIQEIEGLEDPFETWEKRIDELSEQFPDKAPLLGELRLSSIEEAARAKAKTASDAHTSLSSTQPGSYGFLASVAGGFSGALQDPATIASIPLGLPGSGGRTIASRILSTTWREAVVSGATEAAVQPKVQNWRKKAGLPNGLEEAAKSVAGATVLGGLLGGGIRGAVELPGVIRRGRAERAASELPDPPSPETIAGDLSDVRDELKPATRAAVDILEQENAVNASIKSEFGDEFGADMARVMEEADLLAETAGLPVQPKYKPEPTPRRTTRRPQSLSEFLAREGLVDEGGELAALDLDKLSIPGSGRLVRKEGGLPLGRAREMAAEAGYIHGFGSREDAVANSRVDDLVSALREEQAGRRIFAMGDDEQARIWREEGEAIEQHHTREQVRKEIFEASNGVLSADESARALRLVDGGMDVDEAVERVVLYGDTSALEVTADPFEPGSAEFDTQLDALESQFDPEEFIADLLGVDEDGAVIVGERSLGDALSDADRGFDLSQLVEACRLS